MHVQMIDVDDVRGFGEGLVDIAVFEDAVPDDIRTHRRMQDCLVGGGDLAVDDRLQWLVIDAAQARRRLQRWRVSRQSLRRPALPDSVRDRRPWGSRESDCWARDRFRRRDR